MNKIKIKYFSKDIIPVQKLVQGDWIDLRTAEDIDMNAFEHRLIPLGVAMQLPDGYEAHVVPRSSTFKNFGVIQSNHMGVIDESYCGDNDQWYFSAIAFRDTYIPRNTRICQFRIYKKMEEIELELVETLNNPDRGGHGSTGVK